MSDPDQPGEIVLHLRPLPADVPVAVRLRQLLKTTLRRDRLRCVRIDGEGLDGAETGEGPDSTAATP